MHKLLSTIALGLALSAGSATADSGERFTAKLQGGNLSGDFIRTRATGVAQFRVVDSFEIVAGAKVPAKAIEYRLNVAGIDNLFMAHIHVAATGPVADNQPVGPVAFWFVPTTPGAPNSNVKDVDGRLADGFVMTDAQLVGPLTPDPARPDDTGVAGLIKAIKEGRATVVVHTNDLDPTTPTGVAGDSVAGELRGLIR